MFCVDAALIGVLVAFLEIDDLPDWWRILICAVATSLVSNFAIQLLVPSLGVGAVPSGIALGSVVAAIGLRLVCRMSARRILIAVLVYFVVQTAFLTCVYRWAHPANDSSQGMSWCIQGPGVGIAK